MRNPNFKTGPHTVVLEPEDKLIYQSEVPHVIGVLNEDGEEVTQLLSNSHEPVEIRATGATQLEMRIPRSRHSWYDHFKHVDACEKVSSIPIEIPEEAQVPETLEEKMMRFAAAMVEERYGRDSDEMESLEEAMDFDLDGDGDIGLSGYEINEMIEEIPNPESQDREEVDEPSDGAGTGEEEVTSPGESDQSPE
jgi:hypothetical protein